MQCNYKRKLLRDVPIDEHTDLKEIWSFSHGSQVVQLYSCTVPINQLRISLALTVYIVYSCYFLKKESKPSFKSKVLHIGT